MGGSSCRKTVKSLLIYSERGFCKFAFAAALSFFFLFAAWFCFHTAQSFHWTCRSFCLGYWSIDRGRSSGSHCFAGWVIVLCRHLSSRGFLNLQNFGFFNMNSYMDLESTFTIQLLRRRSVAPPLLNLDHENCKIPFLWWQLDSAEIGFLLIYIHLFLSC